MFAAFLLLAAAGADPFISVDEAKAATNARFVFADAEKEFEKEHIKGSGVAFAHDLQILDDVKACGGLPMCEPAAAKLIGSLGIDAQTPVIVYDKGAGANASGTWFFLTLYGHPNVKILDGGLATWKAHGGAVEGGAAAKVPAKQFVTSVKRDMIADVKEVKTATEKPDAYLIVDARHNLDEYVGKSLLSSVKSTGGGEVTVKRGGFIPGAVFSPWTKYANNRNAEPDKSTLKDEADLKKQLEKLKKNGYDAKKTVISYCHVGLGRGSFQYLALKRAGHENVKLYVGSWAEWGSDESLPLGKQP